jgi:hypothetical protein
MIENKSTSLIVFLYLKTEALPVAEAYYHYGS